MIHLRKKNSTRIEIAKESLERIRNSEYIPRTVVNRLGYGHSVVMVINSINGKIQSPNMSYEKVILNARDAKLVRKGLKKD